MNTIQSKKKVLDQKRALTQPQSFVVGNEHNFSFGSFIVQKSAPASMPFSYDRVICTCPNCEKVIVQTEKYVLIEIAIMLEKTEKKEKKQVFMGRAKSGAILRLPDKEFNSKYDYTDFIDSLFAE